MLDVHLPDLSFPGVEFGPLETPWDLRPWLYKGGAHAPVREVASLIEVGKLGRPMVERIELVRLIRESLLNYLEGGGQRATIQGHLDALKPFFNWADKTIGQALSLANVEQNYRHWCDTLLHRVRVGRDIKEKTIHGYGSKVGWVLDKVLERGSPLIKTTRLKAPKNSSRALSPNADKQNLEETFAFGHVLLDLADGLSVDAIWAPLPLKIPLRNGKSLELWSGLKRPEKLKPPNPRNPAQARYSAKLAVQNRAAWEAEKSYRTRYPLINLRIMAEMFILMGQPSLNLAQTHQLRMDQWRFKPSSQGYEIRTYKHRRWGPVVFEIYSEYRAVFDRYLQWRKAIFPDDPDGLLFPLLGRGKSSVQRRLDAPPDFSTLRKACKRAGIAFVGPQALRSTNVNWMLRRTADPDLTADEKQHAKQTLIGVYEKPSLQRAMVQILVFWAKHDPALQAPGPGSCAGSSPEPVANIPPLATQPDCTTPTGCLFCAHQRDIDSLDHVWSLASFRLLKSFELRAQSKAEHPSELAIERITAKLNFIQAISPDRAEWVTEALLRLEEGRYHPAWSGLIESL
ncbi:site-specific integrase [Roseateles albus]|uniref:Site-specific integrase n=1 Tax=Roseateles albus TaxID=2987525 RepID=A0ABT5KKX8_9BURK|nr:site-specific integrase [Roseateles albus]MDC8774047.1 site-specific integrase [Roseateles albus]